MAKIIGIDLGTSNSAAAFLEGGKPVIIPAAEGTSVGGKTTPSFVAFTKDGQRLVGEAARRQAVSNPDGTIYAAKRKMGSNFKFKVFGKDYAPQDISAFILQKIKTDAEAFMGEKVSKAVITVPAYFNDNQRQATKDAGAIAGLDVVRIINEPTAAALAYGLDKSGKDQKIIVFDLGGGTLDVTIMDFGNGVFEVKSTSGDTQLGGTDMDNVLIDYIVGEFKKKNNIDLRIDATAMQRIREGAEKAKIELSTVMETEVNLPFIYSDQTGPKNLQLRISRSTFELLIDPLIVRCVKPIENALKDSGLTPQQVDKIILVGGPTRIPAVQRFLENKFGKDKIARGVDPMECVAVGAAIQGGIIAGDVKDLILLDVTPLTLGIETLGGLFTPIIERNTTIPVTKSQVFTTAQDMQPSVDIRVSQGERRLSRENTPLGNFDLVGIPPAPRGTPQIEVTFDIDVNGILNVTAKDKGTGKSQKITITAPNKLSKEEIEKKVKEAEQMAEEDKKNEEKIQKRNEADHLVYVSEKTLADNAEKMKPELIEEVKKAKEALHNALTENKEDFQTEFDSLKTVLMKVGSQAYQEPNANEQEVGKEQEQSNDSTGSRKEDGGNWDDKK